MALKLDFPSVASSDGASNEARPRHPVESSEVGQRSCLAPGAGVEQRAYRLALLIAMFKRQNAARQQMPGRAFDNLLQAR